MHMHLSEGEVERLDAFEELQSIPSRRKRFAFLKISAGEILERFIQVDFLSICRFTIILM